MTTMRPCLWLTPDETTKALELYERVVPGTRVLSRIHFDNREQPDHSVDVVQLELAGTTVQIMSCTRYSEFTDALSLVLLVEDQQQLDRVWDGFLADGGQEVQCGWIADPFGVRWQVVPQAFLDACDSGDHDQAQRAVEAIWSMTRIDVAEVERAARGR